MRPELEGGSALPQDGDAAVPLSVTPPTDSSIANLIEATLLYSRCQKAGFVPQEVRRKLADAATRLEHIERQAGR
jgi:hypothetical protein